MDQSNNQSIKTSNNSSINQSINRSIVPITAWKGRDANFCVRLAFCVIATESTLMPALTWPNIGPNGGPGAAIPAGMFVFIRGLCITFWMIFLYPFAFLITIVRQVTTAMQSKESFLKHTPINNFITRREENVKCLHEEKINQYFTFYSRKSLAQ